MCACARAHDGVVRGVGGDWAHEALRAELSYPHTHTHIHTGTGSDLITLPYT